MKGIEDFICIIFSINGFRRYHTFVGVTLDANLLAEIVDNVHKLRETSRYYDPVQKLTGQLPSEYVMLPGEKQSLIRISSVMSICVESAFELELLQTRDENREADSLGETRKSSDNTPNKNLTSLDASEDYSELLTLKLSKLMKIADPEFTEPVFDLTPKESSSISQKYNAKCVFCPNKLVIVSVYISKGYVRYGLGNYIKHLKQHEGPAKRLQENEVSSSKLKALLSY